MRIHVAFLISLLLLRAPPLVAQTVTYPLYEDHRAAADEPAAPLVVSGTEPAWPFDPEKNKIILLPVDEPNPLPLPGEAIPLEQLLTEDALRGLDNWEKYQYEPQIVVPDDGQGGSGQQARSSRLAFKPARNFTTGTRAWSLTTEDNSHISLGSNQVSNVYQPGFRIGGIQLSQAPASVQDSWFLGSNQLSYSTTAGAMDYSANAADNPSFSFGSGAANTALRYGLSDDASIDSQVQLARSMKNIGLGTSYAMDDLGDLRLTVNAGRYQDHASWRSMLAYRAKVFDLASLQFSNELTSAHYMDLSRLSQDPLSDRAVRNQLKLSYPLNTRAQISGLVENTHVMSGQSEQQFGLEHSFQLKSLLLRLKAQRAVRSDSGSVNLNLNIPMTWR